MNSRSARLGLLIAAVTSLTAILWLLNRELGLRAVEARVSAQVIANRRAVSSLRDPDARDPSTPAKSAASTAAAPAATNDPAATGNLAQGSRIMQRLQAMPEYAPHERRELRRHTMLFYGGLFAQLNLPPARLEAFKQLLDENYGTRKDAFEAAHARGYGQSSKEYQELMKRCVDEGQEQVRQFLGAEDYQRYQDYETCQYWRQRQLSEIKSKLSLDGLPPLTTDQEAALARAYLESQNWQPAGLKPPYGSLYRMQNDRLGELARGTLSPEQHAAVADYLRFVNEESQLLGQLLHPQDPDAVVISMSSSS